MFTWSKYPQIANRLIELNARNYSTKEIGDIVTKEFPDLVSTQLTRDQVKNAIARAKARTVRLADRPAARFMPYYERFQAEIEGEIIVPKDVSVLEKLLSKSKKQLFLISDLHVPFTDEVKLERAMDLNSGADICVVAGDLMDLYGCSRHRKRTSIPHEVELDNTVRLIEVLSNRFPWVIILRGNHDERAIKKVRDVLPADLLYLVDNEPLDLLTRPFRNVQYIDNWYIQIGDAIIGHQERSSIIEGKPAIYMMEWFLDKAWATRLKLDPTPKVFVTAHTHQISAMYPRDGIKVFECGCMTKTMEYTQDATAFMRPPQNGFVTLVQNGSQTDLNLSREYIL